MAISIEDVGYDWAIELVAKCIEELSTLVGNGFSSSSDTQSSLDFLGEPSRKKSPALSLTCGSGDSLTHIDDGSVDAVVLDPPYFDNVMYAELSDLFYVWLKRTAG